MEPPTHLEDRPDPVRRPAPVSHGQAPDPWPAAPPDWADHPLPPDPVAPAAGPRRPRHRPPPPRLPAAAVALAVGAGLLGGLVGARVAASGGTGSGTVAPVVRPVIASDDSAVDRVEAVAAGLLPVTVQIRSGEDALGATGSGVIMSEDGYVLTNHHVVAASPTITVVLPSSEAVRGHLVGADPSNDLAVVKINKRGLPVATFGSSGDVRIGELAVAVGSPFGLKGSVTAGIVSALHRVVELGGGDRLVNAIQTDASINPGNSGGALANGRGEVIGINTAIATGGAGDANVGVGFAIPIDQALEVAEDLIAGRAIRTPLLGVRGGADLTPEIAERYGLTGRTGALVEQVDPGSPAAAAGMKSGDLVVRIGNSGVHGWDGLVVAVREVEVGQPVTVVVVRRGVELTLTVTPAGRP